MSLKITTKRGDDGLTDAWTKKCIRVEKSDTRIQLIGKIDLAKSYFGLIDYEGLAEIEQTLNRLMGDIMSFNTTNLISEDDITKIEKRIESLQNNLEKLNGWFEFSSCGKNASFALICRATFREAESIYWHLRRKEPITNQNIGIYLNRLSDLFFLIALKIKKS